MRDVSVCNVLNEEFKKSHYCCTPAPNARLDQVTQD